MGLLKGGAIFGLGAAFGMIAARSRDFRNNNKNSPDCPLKKKMKAREMEKKAKELDKANNPDSVTGQAPALA